MKIKITSYLIDSSETVVFEYQKLRNDEPQSLESVLESVLDQMLINEKLNSRIIWGGDTFFVTIKSATKPANRTTCYEVEIYEQGQPRELSYCVSEAIKALFLIISFSLPIFSEEYEIYEIQPGDNLTKISSYYEISIRDIVSINKDLGLNVDKIFAGKKIYIPKKSLLRYESLCFNPFTILSIERVKEGEKYQDNFRNKYAENCLKDISKKLDLSFFNGIINVDDEFFWKTYLSDEGYSYYLINSYHFLNSYFFCKEKIKS